MPSTGNGWLKDLFVLALLIVLVVLPLRAFVVSPFVVDGESMHPTFENLDYLIIDELTYRMKSPMRGDVIVFRYPLDPSVFYIKRIIGLPGETVSINHGIVTIKKENGDSETLSEPYIAAEDATYSKSVTLGSTEYFAMGDNRPNSSDSRVWGPLPAKDIIGRVLLRLLPVAHAGFFPGKTEYVQTASTTLPRTFHCPPMTIRDAVSAEDVLKRAHAIGDAYGFVPFSTLALEHRGERGAKSVQEMPTLPPLDPIAESVSSFLKQCRDTGLTPSTRQPLFVWHTNIAPGRPAPKTAVIQFHAIGTDRVIADTVIIRAMHALARDLTKNALTIRVNTLGDKETRARFARELGNFFKKRVATLPEECTTCAKRDVFEAADILIGREEGGDLPSPTDFLSDASRKRFEELLEYLEMTETPYELASDLISRGSVWQDLCFSIKDEERTLAWGSRYGDLARMYFKSSMPAIGAVLRIETEGKKVAPVKGRGKTRFAFVHIGEEAKRESIKIAEELRRARLPLWQIIGLESLAEQMFHVEKMNPPYLLIMGRKEALEHSAVLRNRNTQEETAIPLSELTERLKEVY